MDATAQQVNGLCAEIISDWVKQTLAQGTNLDRPFNEQSYVFCNKPPPSEGNTLLHWAVKYALVEEVLALLSAGARTDIANAHGKYPKDLALENGDQQCLRILCRREHYRGYCDLVRNFSPKESEELLNTSVFDHVGRASETYLHATTLDNVRSMSSSSSSSSAIALAASNGRVEVDNVVGPNSNSLDILDVPQLDKYLFFNYLDWTSAERHTRLMQLYEKLCAEEAVIHNLTNTFTQTKASALQNLQSISKRALCERETRLRRAQEDCALCISERQQDVERLTSKVSLCSALFWWILG
jgi:hypothetical protein